MKPTVLISTPSYALRIAEEAQKMGFDMPNSTIKYTYHAGEPGPCSIEAIRMQLDEAYGAISGELLGVAELDAIAPGCPNRKGVHMNEMNNYSWTMDPSTGKELMDGEVGENIITTYVNNAQPLINYRTHDLVRSYSHQNHCGCSCTWRYLDGVVLGRSDYMITVKATNVYPSAVENIVLQVPGTTNYFHLVLTRDAAGLDQMEVIFEPKQDIPESDWGKIAGQIQENVKDKIGLRMKVVASEPNSLPRSDSGKMKRVIDKRPKEFRRELDRSQN